MAERKADHHPNIQNGFHIPVDEMKRGRFPHQRPVDVVLNDAHAGYQVYQKDIPDHLSGATYHSKSVHWMNNFGLKLTDKNEFAGDVPEYSILIEQIEGGEYVYFDGKEIRPLAISQYEADLRLVQAALKSGDPPIGWVG
jgi:hypothetical protein